MQMLSIYFIVGHKLGMHLLYNLRALIVGTHFMDSNMSPNLLEFKFDNIEIVYKMTYFFGCHNGA